jgi:hypothetical protein
VKKIAFILALLSLCLVSCLPAETVDIPTIKPVPVSISPVQTDAEATIKILPDHVFVSNFDDGDTAEYPITIHNGTNQEVTMSISYMIPNRVAEGYAFGTEEQAAWFSYEGDNVFAPYETRDITAILTMPKKTKAPAEKWEFWVKVTAVTGGTVNLACACKWRVDMK